MFVVWCKNHVAQLASCYNSSEKWVAVLIKKEINVTFCLTMSYMYLSTMTGL